MFGATRLQVRRRNNKLLHQYFSNPTRQVHFAKTLEPKKWSQMVCFPPRKPVSFQSFPSFQIYAKKGIRTSPTYTRYSRPELPAPTGGPMPLTLNGNAEDSCLKNHNNTLQHDPDRERDIEKTDPAVIGDADNADPTSNGSTSPTLDEEEYYPEGGLQGWLVTFGSFCGMFTVFGLINSSGVFEAYFKANQLAGYSDSQIGWVFSLYLFLVFFIGIQVGPIFDQYGTRVLVAVGSIFIVTSLMLLSISKGKFPTNPFILPVPAC